MKFGLNIGSGRTRMQANDVQWINLDNDPSTNPEVNRDIRYGLPYDNDKFDIIMCSHVLEHFGGEEFVRLMNEIHRVLKPDGELHILSPYYKDDGAWIDPHHKMFFREKSFEPFWLPTNTSQDAGVRGWFFPLVIEVAEQKELRMVMKKVATEQLKEYIEKVSDRSVGGELVPPDFVSKLKGTKYYHKAEVVKELK